MAPPYCNQYLDLVGLHVRQRSPTSVDYTAKSIRAVCFYLSRASFYSFLPIYELENAKIKDKKN